MKNIDRKNSQDRRWNMKHLSEKYHANENVIANHVADFDYATPEFIFKKINDRCKFKSLSYFSMDDEYYNSMKYWYKEMKGVNIEKSWINYSYGVIFSMAAIINTKTNIGDSILINTPCYNPFNKVCELNERKPIRNKLILKNGKYELDFQSIEEDIVINKVKLYLFCNPLNPTGRLWTLEELNKIASICNKYNVLLISDEVHGDLVSYKDGFVSAIKIDDEFKNNVIVVSSATKAFNLGGMSSSYNLSKNVDLLKDIWKFQEKIWLGNSNIFGVEIMKAAYSKEGIEWVNEMKVNHSELFEYVKDFILNNNLPISATELESGFCATLLIKDDISKLNDYKTKFLKAGILVRFNDEFYDHDNLWFRLILSTDKKTVEELMNRIKKIFKEA